MVKTITVLFDLAIRPHEIPYFKKEILHLQDPKNDVWHNHVVEAEDADFENSINVKNNKMQGKNYRRYPLIQFRAEKWRGRSWASLWGIGRGCEEVKEFLRKGTALEVRWGQRKRTIGVMSAQEREFPEPTVWTDLALKRYSLTHFLPFNEDRYKEFRSKFFFADKLELIERMAAHNIALYLQEFHPEVAGRGQLVVKATDLKGFNTAKYTPRESPGPLTFVSVDLHLGINADLPAGISLGNLKALGYGVLRPIAQKSCEEDKVV